MTAAVLVVILLVVLALVFVIAIVGMVVAMVRAWPERPADLDPYLNVHGEVPNLPWAARRCATERLSNSSAASAGDDGGPAPGRKATAPAPSVFFRGSL